MTGRIATVALAAAALFGSVLAPAALAAPATPTGFTSAIEDFQPYVGQSTCDPVAKPGVRAFMNLLLDTYPDTSSDGIVRDCGSGGQSEHKEGRAFDWAVSANNATDVKHVNDVLTWLMATDKFGNKDAMVRRLGIMYIIWNKRMWRAYAPEKGWQAYSGESEHTDHVHFSFGWAGANKDTSYWTGHVAPIERSAHDAPALPTVTPAIHTTNLPVLASYGTSTLTSSSTGAAVKVLQTALKRPATGSWTDDTTQAVEQFQRQQGLTVEAAWGPDDWTRLFPKPVNPFGLLEHVDTAQGSAVVTGWAVDAGDDVPLTVHVYVDGKHAATTTEAIARPDVTAQFTAYTAAHGFQVAMPLSDGKHTVCAYGINAPDTTGSNGLLSCQTLTVQHGPVGALESISPSPQGLQAIGFAVDPDSDKPVSVHVHVDGTQTQVLDAASVARDDLADRFPKNTSAHGFAFPLTVADGKHAVCLYGVNVSGTPGAGTLLGCQTITVNHGGVGVLDPVVQPLATVTVSGAALDPDTSAPVSAAIKVDGKDVKTVTANLKRTAPAGYAAWGDTHGFSTSLALTQGAHTVCAYALNAPKTPGTTRLIGCKSVKVNHSPFGNEDAVTPTASGLVVTGWAADPDTTAATGVQLLLDGAKAGTARASLNRPDIAKRYPALGAAHGFRGVVPTPVKDGPHQVCAVISNVSTTTGSNTKLPCITFTERHSPLGSTPVLGRRGSQVSVAGWAVDPDSNDPILTHVYVDGKYATATKAGLTRAGIPAPWNGYGTAHGYDVAVDVPAGSHQVCVYGLNAGTGKNALLGSCATVVVKHTPFGNISRLESRTDGVAITGFAIDPDTTAPITVHVFVDNALVKTLTASQSRPEVGTAYPDYGPAHGFQTLVKMAAGAHTVCVHADNATDTPGASGVFPCAKITV